MVEELRGIGERFVLTLLNLKVIGEKDFDHQITGAVLLNEEGRKKFIQKWQEKKRSMVYHPIIRKKYHMVFCHMYRVTFWQNMYVEKWRNTSRSC